MSMTAASTTKPPQVKKLFFVALVMLSLFKLRTSLNLFLDVLAEKSCGLYEKNDDKYCENDSVSHL